MLPPVLTSVPDRRFVVEFFPVEHRLPTAVVRITHGGRTIAFSVGLPCRRGPLQQRATQTCSFATPMGAERDGDGARNRTRNLMHPMAREAAEICKQGGAIAWRVFTSHGLVGYQICSKRHKRFSMDGSKTQCRRPLYDPTLAGRPRGEVLRRACNVKKVCDGAGDAWTSLL
jgi:hypothetical protein